MTALYEKVGIKYRVSPVPYALRHFDPHMLLIAATRYFIGRMTIATCSFAQDELAKAWPHIPQKTRAIIRRELEEATTANRGRQGGRWGGTATARPGRPSAQPGRRMLCSPHRRRPPKTRHQSAP